MTRTQEMTPDRLKEIEERVKFARTLGDHQDLTDLLSEVKRRGELLESFVQHCRAGVEAAAIEMAQCDYGNARHYLMCGRKEAFHEMLKLLKSTDIRAALKGKP